MPTTHDSLFTDVRFTDLKEDIVSQYVSTGKPLIDKAGSYGIQDAFGLYAVAEINGSYTKRNGTAMYANLQVFRGTGSRSFVNSIIFQSTHATAFC